MFDYLDNRGSVKAFQPAIAIGQRSLKQSSTIAHSLRHAIEAFAGNLQGARRHIDADEFGEPWLFQQQTKQLALAASQVEDALCTTLAQHRRDRVESLFVQRDAFLD